MYVDLRSTAEDDAVLVDEINRALGLDLPKIWLGTPEGSTIRLSAIQLLVPSLALPALWFEIEQRVGTNVEARPSQNRFLRVLHHGDRGLAIAARLRRQACALPHCRIACIRRNLQPAWCQTIRHATARSRRSTARRGLHSLHCLNRAHRRCQRMRDCWVACWACCTEAIAALTAAFTAADELAPPKSGRAVAPLNPPIRVNVNTLVPASKAGRENRPDVHCAVAGRFRWYRTMADSFRARRIGGTRHCGRTWKSPSGIIRWIGREDDASGVIRTLSLG